jgi:hypothetical protein
MIVTEAMPPRTPVSIAFSMPCRRRGETHRVNNIGMVGTCVRMDGTRIAKESTSAQNIKFS